MFIVMYTMRAALNITKAPKKEILTFILTKASTKRLSVS